MNRSMADLSPTHTLLAAARAGNRQAFDTLVASFRDRLAAALGPYLASRPDAARELDEVVNETFARAFESIGSFEARGDDSFLPWLFGIAKHVAQRAARDAHATPCLEIDERVSAPGTTPSQAVRRDERFDRLEDAVARLKPEYRQVLRLVRLDGLKIRDAAARMGRSENAVSHLLARALGELRALVGETESFHLPPRTLATERDDHDA
jgi:RNA polymerase sigma-70 factor, ECF subfamily